MTKVCQGCGESRNESDFPVRNDRSGRLRPYCKDCRNDVQRARYKHHRTTKPFLHRCTRAKSRAKSLSVAFDLTPEYLESIWTGYCPIRGVELKLDTNRKDEDAAELDRFDPDLEYVQGNVHWMSRKANRLKNNTSIEDLESLLNWMNEVMNES